MLRSVGLLVLGLFFAVGASGANAATIDIAGVSVDTGPAFINGNFRQTYVENVGDELTGFGRLTEIQGNSIAFLTGGQSLMFEFGGFTVDTVISANQFAFTGGWLDIYLGPDQGAAYYTDPANATAGNTLWLSLVAQPVNGGITLASTSDTSALGFFSVNEANPAPANSNFNTNTLLGGLADLSFTSSFQPAGPGNVTPPGDWLSGSFDSQGFVIPEPGAFALLSLGLLAAGARRPRRNAA